ncbi:hypothetical protein EII18_05365 [Comamonadaceae bacterium OH3737_COT-264]|nr:hypothetical protein EII18_05365 [Comamonadaceae bacterium OH3737_COT-264]
MTPDRLTPYRQAMHRQSRVDTGLRLRALYRSAGFSRAEAAQFLQVTERTLHNWESGKHAAPAAVLKLLRIWAGYELPGKDWAGWSMHSGKLWSPEGYGFNPHDSAWWSLLCRRAAYASELHAQLSVLKRGLAPLRASVGSDSELASAPGQLRRETALAARRAAGEAAALEQEGTREALQALQAVMARAQARQLLEALACVAGQAPRRTSDARERFGRLVQAAQASGLEVLVTPQKPANFGQNGQAFRWQPATGNISFINGLSMNEGRQSHV